MQRKRADPAEALDQTAWIQHLDFAILVGVAVAGIEARNAQDKNIKLPTSRQSQHAKAKMWRESRNPPCWGVGC
jgi:hypothetical protein